MPRGTENCIILSEDADSEDSQKCWWAEQAEDHHFQGALSFYQSPILRNCERASAEQGPFLATRGPGTKLSDIILVNLNKFLVATFIVVCL